MSFSSPMQFEQCNLTNLVIKTRANGEAIYNDEDLADIKLTYNVRHHRVERKFRIPFTLTITWPEEVHATFAYLEIGLDGIFTFPSDTPDATIQHFVPLLCLTNLYGVARGILIQATSLCEGGPYMLSLVNMEQLLKSIARQEHGSGFDESAYADAGAKLRTVKVQI